MSDFERLAMELRTVDADARHVVGVCVPYDETSYLVPNPHGERIRRGAFNKSIAERGATRLFLNLDHDEGRVVGRSVAFADEADGLIGTFHIRRSELGDQTLRECDDGYWPFMSVGFKPLQHGRGSDGAVEVTEAYLGHVALCRTAAYAGAEVLAVRKADPAAIMAAFGKRPDVDLTPIPRIY